MWKGAHFEKTVSKDAAILYCSKDESRLVGTTTEYYGWLREKNYKPDECTIKPHDKIDYTLPLRPWQRQVVDLLQEQHPRQVLWIADTTGNAGKSYLSGRLTKHTPGALLVSGGRQEDLMYMLAQMQKEKKEPTLLIMDIPRTTSPECVSYSTFETVKNARICSTKYESTSLETDRPLKVLVMANFLPVWTKMSLDRWQVHRIEGAGSNPEMPLQPVPVPEPLWSLQREDSPPAFQACSHQATGPGQDHGFECPQVKPASGEDAQHFRDIIDEMEGMNDCDF